jgi:hypothetical protein
MTVNPIKIVGIVLLVAGIIALGVGHFSYPTEKHEAKIGKLDFQVQKKETVHIPPWAGWVGIVAGVLILVVPIPQRT